MLRSSVEQKYKNQKRTEWIWQASGTRGQNAEMFVHLLESHYCGILDGPPERSFIFEDPKSVLISPGNLAARAIQLTENLERRWSYMQTDQLLVP